MNSTTKNQSTAADLRPDPLLVRLAEDLFADTCTRDVVAAAETGTWASRAWTSAAESGLPLLGIDDELGGSGGTLLDAVVMLEAAGRHSAPLPLLETNIAAWLLTAAGLTAPEGPASFVPGTPRDTLRVIDGFATGNAYDVPWAEDATALVAVVAGDSGQHLVIRLERAQYDTVPGRDLADIPRSRVSVAGAAVVPQPSAIGPQELALRAMLLRAAQMSGAMDAVTALTLRYTAVREQFGRAIRAFQYVQQHLVIISQLSALAKMSVERAALSAARGPAAFEILSAKLTANSSADAVARSAHQAHGAIGMTREYDLQQLTRRLWAWRGEFGTTDEISRRLGAAVADCPDLYAVVTAGSRLVEV